MSGQGVSCSHPSEPSPFCSDRSKRLLDDGPVVIASIAGLLEQLDPAVRIVVELSRQHPFLEQFLLFRGAIGIDLNKAFSRREALDLAQGRDQRSEERRVGT